MASVRKRSWTYKGEKRTAWVADYFDRDGVRRQKTFGTKGEASDWLNETVGQVKRGTHTPDSTSPTVSEAAEAWITRSEKKGLEPSTVRQRRQHVDLHIVPFIGREKLSRLTAPRVQQFLESLRDYPKKPRSPAMVRKVFTSLKSLISHAQSRGLVAQNVARDVDIRDVLADTARDDDDLDVGEGIPTKPEIARMIETADGRWRPLVITAIFTGMRASELRGLTWDHVDLDAGVIRVRQRADAWNTIGRPKSKASRRDIPIGPFVGNTLREWKLACPNGPLDLVFPNGRGNVETQANVYHRGYVPLLLECGIVDGDGKARYDFHALRHAAVSLWIDQGMSPKKVQTMAGHSKIGTTMDIYAKLFKDPEGDQEAMARAEASLLG